MFTAGPAWSWTLRQERSKNFQLLISCSWQQIKNLTKGDDFLKSRFFCLTLSILIFSMFIGIIFSTAGCGGGGVPGVPSQGPDPSAVPTNITFPTPSSPDKVIYRVISDVSNGWVSGSPIGTNEINGSTASAFGFQLDTNGNGFQEVNKGEYNVGVYQNQTDTSPLFSRSVNLSGESFVDDYSTTPATATPTLEPTPGPGTPTWTPVPPTATPIPGQPTNTPVTPVPAPVVTLIAPLGGQEGTEVTIMGSNLLGCTVTINEIDQSSGIITQTDSLISFNVVAGTYSFLNGFNGKVKVEKASGFVEDIFVCYKWETGLAETDLGWEPTGCEFTPSGTSFYLCNSTNSKILLKNFSGRGIIQESSPIFGGPTFICYNQNSTNVFVNQGAEGGLLPFDLSSINYFGGGDFSGQTKGITNNALLSNKVFYLDDASSPNYFLVSANTDGTNVTTVSSLTKKPWDLASDETGNFYYSSSDNNVITQLNSSGVEIFSWSQIYAKCIECLDLNGKTFIISTGLSGGNAIISVFLIETGTAKRLFDITLPVGWALDGISYSNGNMVVSVSNQFRIETFTF